MKPCGQVSRGGRGTCSLSCQPSGPVCFPFLLTASSVPSLLLSFQQEGINAAQTTALVRAHTWVCVRVGLHRPVSPRVYGCASGHMDAGSHGSVCSSETGNVTKISTISN